MRRRVEVSAVLAAAAWALGTWCAAGAVSPADATSGSRVGVFAPTWLLGGLVVVAVALAAASRLSARNAAPLWLTLLSALPWLPIPLPAAALLAVGPLGLILAAACAFGTVLAAQAESMGGWSVHFWPAAAVALLVALFCASAWWISPRIPDGDEPHYLIITQSLLTDGDLRIENNHRHRDYATYLDREMKPDYLRRGRDDAIYSIHAPGVAALVLPAFALGGYRGAVVQVALIAALGLIVTWRAAKDVTGNDGAAGIATVGVGLSVPFFFHAFTIFPDGPAAVLVMTVVWLALIRPGRFDWPHALASGLLLGALPWLHTRYVAIAGPLALVILARVIWPREAGQSGSARARAAAALLLPTLVGTVAWLWLFYAIYGVWDPRAPYGHATDLRLSRIPHGLAGLLLDQQFGLLPNAPIYAIALLGLRVLCATHRRLTLELLAMALPYVAAVSAFHMWWAGHSSPARFLVPVLLPLAVPLAASWTRRSRAMRSLTTALLASSVGLSAAFVLVDRGAFIYNLRDGHALWLLAASAPANLTYALPSLFQGGPARAGAVGAAWLLVLAGVLWALRQLERRPMARGPWTAAVLGGTAVVALCGTSVGWALSSHQARDPGAGLLGVAARACHPALLGMRPEPFAIARARHLITGVVIPDASRRPAPDAGRRWSATDVPPGRYQVAVTPGLNVSGTATVAMGQPDQVLSLCAFGDAATSSARCDISLPAGAVSLWITGDATLARSTEQVGLTLVEPGAPELCDLRAKRVVSSAAGKLFVVGGRAWAEGGGMWTGGGGEVALVAEPAGPATTLRIRQGQADGIVHVMAGAWTQDRRLSAGEIWDLEIPRSPSGRAAVATIATMAGFRPSDRDPSSTDARLLGAWVEPR